MKLVSDPSGIGAVEKLHAGHTAPRVAGICRYREVYGQGKRRAVVRAGDGNHRRQIIRAHGDIHHRRSGAKSEIIGGDGRERMAPRSQIRHHNIG